MLIIFVLNFQLLHLNAYYLIYKFFIGISVLFMCNVYIFIKIFLNDFHLLIPLGTKTIYILYNFMHNDNFAWVVTFTQVTVKSFNVV